MLRIIVHMDKIYFGGLYYLMDNNTYEQNPLNEEQL